MVVVVAGVFGRSLREVGDVQWFLPICARQTCLDSRLQASAACVGRWVNVIKCEVKHAE